MQQHCDGGQLTNILVHVIGRLPQPVQARLVPRVIAVREVEARHVHAALDQLLELRHLPACRTERAEDFGPAIAGGALAFDGVQGDVAAGQQGYVARRADHFGGCCSLDAV